MPWRKVGLRGPVIEDIKNNDESSSQPPSAKRIILRINSKENIVPIKKDSRVAQNSNYSKSLIPISSPALLFSPHLLLDFMFCCLFSGPIETLEPHHVFDWPKYSRCDWRENVRAETLQRPAVETGDRLDYFIYHFVA